MTNERFGQNGLGGFFNMMPPKPVTTQMPTSNAVDAGRATSGGTPTGKGPELKMQALKMVTMIFFFITTFDFFGKYCQDASFEYVIQKFKVKNKNANDMFAVSKFFLQGGLKQNLMRTIRKNLGVTDPKVLKGIEHSLTQSFKKIQMEAIHVGPGNSEDTSKEIDLTIPF